MYALSDIIGEGEDVIKIGLEIMSTLKNASMNGANIYVHPSLYKSKLNWRADSSIPTRIWKSLKSSPSTELSQ